MTEVTLGFSTCPNDTFMFDALVHERIDTQGIRFKVVLGDILHLNEMALAGELDMVKVSYNTYGWLRDTYHLLEAGSALGYNCGPLLISKRPLQVSDIVEQGLTVGIPGVRTTANLLLGYYAPDIQHKRELIFHEIMPALLNEEIDAGVIIHENRFTYAQQGLQLIQDLGTHWEQQTGLPIPLGAIVAHKRLGTDRIAQLESLMRESVAYAFAHPGASRLYVRTHAQEMEDAVMQAHIDLYVNKFSLELGEQGHSAIQQLLQTGAQMGLYAAPIT